MASPADQRLLELLEKWLMSLELHLKYAALDDAAYLQMQPWPNHQRPSRWILDLAKQKASALHAQVEERVKMGDARFSESLELMAFLANLVGAEHIERFIPLADPRTERALGDNRTEAPAGAVTGTREMPTLAMSHSRDPAADSMHDLVIADAARLVQGGSKWYELAELISAIADRPSLIAIRRILIDNKTVIEKKAGRG